MFTDDDDFDLFESPDEEDAVDEEEVSDASGYSIRGDYFSAVELLRRCAEALEQVDDAVTTGYAELDEDLLDLLSALRKDLENEIPE